MRSTGTGVQYVQQVENGKKILKKMVEKSLGETVLDAISRGKELKIYAYTDEICIEERDLKC